MPNYLRPDSYIEEVKKSDRPITGASTSITGFLGLAEKGPVNEAIRITSIADFKRVFGNALAGHALYYSVAGFFNNGGSVAYVVRLAHYTDITDATSRVGASALKNLPGIGEEAFAAYTGDVDVTLLDLVAEIDAAGGTLNLNLDINNIGSDTAALVGARATHAGAMGTYPNGFTGVEWIDIKIDGGDTQRITFAAGDDATEIKSVAALNKYLLGGRAVGSGGGMISIISDTMGNNSSVEIVAVSAAQVTVSTGIAVGSTAISGEAAADFSAMTFAELKALVEDEIKTAVAGDKVVLTQDPSGFLVLTVTAGAAATSELDQLGTTTASLVVALGLSGLGSQAALAVAVGSASAAATAFVLNSGYRSFESPGTKGNSTQVEVLSDPLRPSLGVGNDLASAITAADTLIKLTTLKGVRVGSILKLAGGGQTEYVKVNKAETVIVAGVAEHQVTLSEAITNGFATGVTTCESVEVTIVVYVADVEVERWEQLSVNSDSDNYVLNLLNDLDIGSSYLVATDSGLTYPANILVASAKSNLAGGTSEITAIVDADVTGDESAKLGVHSLDGISELNLLVVAPTRIGTTGINASTAVHHKALDWCANRMNCFAILDVPESLSPAVTPMTPAQAVVYRSDRLGADIGWGALYFPFVKVADPLGSGRNPTTWMPPSGFIAGVFARVDAIGPPDGGVFTAPAGIENGKMKSVVGLRHSVSDAEHDTLNPVGVNAIREFRVSGVGGSAPGIVCFGARTLSTDVADRYIQVRRGLTLIEQSIRLNTLWAVFKNNDSRLWGRIKQSIEDYLRDLWDKGQLYGASVNEAFFVKMDDTTTTAEDIENGRAVAEIGVALIRPAEFVIFRIAQIQGNTQVQE
jgi:uncharacterized protein